MSDSINSDQLLVQESLNAYKSQLKQIQEALQVASDEQKPDLWQIEKDLEEIIQLTESSLSTEVLEKKEGDNEEPNLEEELSALEGMKCKVPFKYEWGGIGYHNAVVLDSEVQENVVYIKAVFMHPTMKKMQPCPYYLEGNCKYSEEKCHYSHGYVVRLDELQDFEDPDYSKIIEGCTVLGKYKDGLWYRGTVEDIIKGTEFSVKFLHCNDILLLNLHSVYPLDEEDDDSSTDSSTAEDDDALFTPRFIESNVDEGMSNPFGFWEKHTRGIGSALMAKMGYVPGSGLGTKGEGRVDPVEAMVFPPGRSLDRCMELREKAGNECMLSVEKKLEREKAKAERSLRQSAKAAENASVFDFINSKLTVQNSKAGTSHPRQKMAELGQLSREKLNVHGFQIGEEILKAERDIAKMKQTLQRQSDRGDLASVSLIRLKMAEKQKELDHLRASDRSIAKEQKERKSSSKLTIF